MRTQWGLSLLPLVSAQTSSSTMNATDYIPLILLFLGCYGLLVLSLWNASRRRMPTLGFYYLLIILIFPPSFFFVLFFVLWYESQYYFWNRRDAGTDTTSVVVSMA